MRKLAIIAVFLGLAVQGLAKDHAWREGKLLNTTSQSYTTYGSSHIHGEIDGNGEFDGHASQSSWDHTAYWFKIEDERYIYVASHVLSWRWSKEAKVTVNAPIKFAIDGSKFYILDEAGREHKLRLDKRTLK